MFSLSFEKINSNQLTAGNLPAEPTRSKISTILSEFFKNTTIHGVPHLTDRKRHWFERIWWIIAIAAALIYCVYQIGEIWLIWNNCPVTLRMDNDLKSVGDIPFPSVSICPNAKFNADKFNYTSVYRALAKIESRNITPNELKQMKVATEICNADVAGFVTKNLADEYMDDDIISTIKDFTPDLNETFFECYLFESRTDCTKIFHLMLTEVGVCYTFNSLNFNDKFTDQMFRNGLIKLNLESSNWSPDSGYSEPDFLRRYPYRTFGSGKHFGLTVILKTYRHNVDALCAGGFDGYRVTFHSPIENPQMYKTHTHISFGKTVSYSIEPNVIYTRPSARKYSPHVRKCFFDTERKLRFYNHYTQNNCRMECIANYTMSLCGCAKFLMPRTNDTKICGPGKIDCFNKLKNVLFKDLNSREYNHLCGCLPSCTDISYNAYSSEANYDHVKTYPASDYPENYKLENATYSRLMVSFKEEIFSPIVRVEHFSLVELLAYCGGLAGLFMGASILSIIELLYYFTLRIFLMYRGNRRVFQENQRVFVPVGSRNQANRQPPRNQHIVYTFLP